MPSTINCKQSDKNTVYKSFMCLCTINAIIQTFLECSSVMTVKEIKSPPPPPHTWYQRPP